MPFESGNAIVGQSGGPTAAINATLAGVIKGANANKNIKTVYGMRHGIQGLEKENIIEIGSYFQGGKNQYDLLCSTPAACLGSCRKKIADDLEAQQIFDVLEKYDIRYFFYIGGNDSMGTILYLSDYAERNKDKGLFEVRFIGVPKTIDNDLVLTDHTPGFGSAAKFVACTMQEMIRDCSVYVKKAVTIVEIMGRDAGWLTASSALTKHICGIGPDFIYVPEAVFDEEQFISDVKEKLEYGDNPYVVIAVSEGIRTADGKYAAEKIMNSDSDEFGHIALLSGAGKYLEMLVKDRIGCKCRSVELNILQRCASHIASRCDIEESVKIGEAAVRHALNGESGKVMCFRRVRSSSEYKVEVYAEEVSDIANKIKTLPKSFLSGDGKGVSDKCIEYMLPLIKGENPVIYEDGLPVHFEF